MQVPWRTRRLYFAATMRCKPSSVPDGARFVCLRRPPQRVFDRACELARERNWKDVQP